MADVIEEFLVAVGVKLDQAGFDRALSGARKSVDTIGKQISGSGKGQGASIAAAARRFASSSSVPGAGSLAQGVSAIAESGGPIGVVLAAVAAGALGVAAMAKLMESTVAASFEKMFFSARIAGSSVSALKSFQYGMSQIGVGADQAAQAIASLGIALKYNPGEESLLNSIGVQTRKADGNLRDTRDIFEDLIGQLRKMPPYLQAAYAGMFGISTQLLESLQQGRAESEESQKAFEEAAKKWGLNLDQLGDRSHTFMHEWRRSWADLEIVWDRIGNDSLPMLTKALSAFADEVEALPAQWKNVYDYMAATIEVLSDRFKSTEFGKSAIAEFESIKTAVEPMWSAFVDFIGDQIRRIPQDMDAAFAYIKAATEVFLKWGNDHGLSRFFKRQWEDSKREFGYVEQFFTASVKKIVSWMNLLANTKVGRWVLEKMGVAWQELKSLNDAIVRQEAEDTASGGKPVTQTLGDLADAIRTRKAADEAAAESGAGPSGSGPVVPGPSSGPLGVRNNNPGNLRVWPTQVGSNSGFAVFPNVGSGLAAMRDNLKSYGAKGFDTIASIVNRWAPSSDGNNTMAYIARVARELHRGASEHLDLNDPKTLAGLMRAMIRVEQGSVPYSQDAIDRAAGLTETSPVRSGVPSLLGPDGKPRVSMNQTTNIHVSGAGDPGQVASRVGSAQRRVNGDLVRWYTGAVLG